MRIVDNLVAMFSRSPEPVAPPVPVSVGSWRSRGRVRAASSNPDNPHEQNQWRKLGAASVRNLTYHNRQNHKPDRRNKAPDAPSRPRNRGNWRH